MGRESSKLKTRAFAAGLVLAAALVACRLPPPATTPAVGAAAPDFQLPASDGSTFRLGEHLGDGPVILVFYRGHW